MSKMLGAVSGMGVHSGESVCLAGNSYTRSIAMWGSEIGWRRQNQALRRCMGAAYGPCGEKVERIMGVESEDTIMDAAQTRFFARAARG